MHCYELQFFNMRCYDLQYLNIHCYERQFNVVFLLCILHSSLQGLRCVPSTVPPALPPPPLSLPRPPPPPPPPTCPLVTSPPCCRNTTPRSHPSLTCPSSSGSWGQLSVSVTLLDVASLTTITWHVWNIPPMLLVRRKLIIILFAVLMSYVGITLFQRWHNHPLRAI